MASSLESALNRAVKGGKSLVKVGFIDGSTHPGGQPTALIAFWAEYGTETAPPRPYFRNMIAKHKGEWGAQLAKILAANGGDAPAALASMGEVINDELRASILETNEPALSPITLMLRKMRDNDSSLRVTGATVGEAARRVDEGETGATGTRAKVLVDTGFMYRRTSYNVVEGVSALAGDAPP